MVLPRWRGQQAIDVRVDLGREHVVARHGHAVAADRGRLAADEMVVLVGGHDEQRVVLGDAVAASRAKNSPKAGS